MMFGGVWRGKKLEKKADVKSFQEEAALGQSSEGRAAEQHGLKAHTKTGGHEKDMVSAGNWAHMAWPLGC